MRAALPRCRVRIFRIESFCDAIVTGDDPETAKLTGVYHDLIRSWAEV